MEDGVRGTPQSFVIDDFHEIQCECKWRRQDPVAAQLSLGWDLRIRWAG